MKAISPEEKKAVENLFSDSIYRNNHLGWLDLWELPDTGGSIHIFEKNSFRFLIGIQPAADNICWLHSFYCSSRPAPELNLLPALRTFFHNGIRSVYSISSHKWYSELLERNGFKLCDEIIEFVTDRITFPHPAAPLTILPLSDSMIPSVMENCEQSFPALWRLSNEEMRLAFSGADYRKMIGDPLEAQAYILAELTDKNCHILRLSTNTGHQNSGYATGLIRQMVLDFSENEITEYSVNTNKMNSAAVNFYRSLNFVRQDPVYPVYHRYI